MIKKIIKTLLQTVLRIFPCENIIMFESVPDFADNTMPVFEEMLRRGLNQKYKMVWWVNEVTDDLPKFANVSYIDEKTALNRRIFQWYRFRAKCFICCNRIFEKKLDKQTTIYISHGTTVKSTIQYYALPEELIDYALIASEPSKQAMAYQMGISEEKVVALGYPRNDVMGYVNKDLHAYFEQDYKKIIVWYPTYRQHKNANMICAKNALPILHDTEQAIRLNEIAKAQGVLLVVKPHFAQDVSYIKDYNLSNILFIDDSFFRKNNLTSYEFVASCDALITDYSSIYYDYLLCDKPVAVVWEDIEEYRKNPGFGVDVDEKMKCASKIYTLEEFEEFLKDVAIGNDIYKDLRKEINAWANYSTDGKNAERVTDFIIDKAKL